MSVAITNYRKRLMTLLLVGNDGVRPVRIPSGHTVEGLPDSVLDLPRSVMPTAPATLVENEGMPRT